MTTSPNGCNHKMLEETASPASDCCVQKKYIGCHAALLRSLNGAGVKFIRYTVVDPYNSVRCKVMPVHHALKSVRDQIKNSSLSPSFLMDYPVSIAEGAYAGLPSTVDHLVEESNLTARNILTLQPDYSSLRILPYAPTTANVMCTGHDQYTGELSPLCTRGLLEKVLQTARQEMGLEFSVGAELEFMLFSSSKAASTNGDNTPQPVDFSNYASSQALNGQDDFINSLYDQLLQQEIDVELVQSECAPGQFEVVLQYSNNVLQVADDVVSAQQTIQACAKQYGMKALFIPKTSMEEVGSGLHLHFSFKEVQSKTGSQNAFADPNQPHGISKKGENFIEGMLANFASLLTFTLPTTNSFRRMGQGNLTGHDASWSIEDKEVPIRVCLDLSSRKVTNVEYKLMDGTANIYLALAVILTSGMEGIKNEKKLRPMAGDGGGTGEPLPKSLIESINLFESNDLLLSLLGPKLTTAYLAIRKFEIKEAENLTIEEEVMAAYKKA